MPSLPVYATQYLRYSCIVLLVISLIAASYNLTRRIHAENVSRAVDVVVDYQQLSSLAASQGISLDLALEKIKAAGATSVALPEETLISLKEQGKLIISGKIGWANIDQYLPAGWSADDPASSIITADATVRTQDYYRINARFTRRKICLPSLRVLSCVVNWNKSAC